MGCAPDARPVTALPRSPALRAFQSFDYRRFLGSRLLSGAGYTLKVPAIDLAEIGAGGGSILWIDAGGALQIGPHSAGASPGPVAYDQGGSEPTVTDANLVLGYLNPGYLVGGALKLNAAKSRAVISEKIAGSVFSWR